MRRRAAGAEISPCFGEHRPDRPGILVPRSEVRVDTIGRSMSTPETTRATGWVGWIWFAGLLLIMLGAFNIIQGFGAVFAVTCPWRPKAGAILDATGWGWPHIIVGLLAPLAGYRRFSGATWSRVFAVIVVDESTACAAGVANFHPGGASS